MRNLVLFTAELTDSDKELSPSPLVATFTIAASHKNTSDMTLSDGKAAEVLVPPGGQYRFERVDLSSLLVRGKAGETVYVVGHTA